MAVSRIYYRKAFTLLELLVVIAILMILAGLLFLGGRSMINSSRVGATRTTMANLRSMYTELEVATKSSLPQPAQWFWLKSDTTTNQDPVDPSVPATAILSLNFWKVPYRQNPATAAIDPVDPLIAPGLVTDRGADASVAYNANSASPSEDDRNLHRAIKNTQIAATLIQRVTINRDVVNKMPSSQQFIPEWRQNATYITNWSYVRSNKQVFQYTKAGLGNSATAPPNIDWATPQNPPIILLDGWSNPIIFVPASGLIVAVGGQTRTITSPDGKPFWASAGLDGDFSKGDDNIYSFEGN